MAFGINRLADERDLVGGLAKGILDDAVRHSPNHAIKHKVGEGDADLRRQSARRAHERLEELGKDESDVDVDGLQGAEAYKSGDLGVASDKREKEDEDAERHEGKVEDTHDGEEGNKGQCHYGHLLKHVPTPLEPVREGEDVRKACGEPLNGRDALLLHAWPVAALRTERRGTAEDAIGRREEAVMALVLRGRDPRDTGAKAEALITLQAMHPAARRADEERCVGMAGARREGGGTSTVGTVSCLSSRSHLTCVKSMRSG
eukprot:CAMPEP_0173390102 /NCGR_PEP_ID=MMETSP1356-20130122/14298_1 /TAXON_ID=77927 ORGANISM="Hemiselmis virescens, Strain PCC157" /NCGR_SAMPLE_ID=MMETSP1356 /ASSEMBLY_ACC=CAM_ASM_000847 /LENGTH=259 /DNA_ID=CAMNT_0014347423 /DNA_START=259 /DNA_END=1040 /DNA_ORIENTATION=-